VIPSGTKNLDESSPYFQIFINTLLCNSNKITANSDVCTKIAPLPSTIIDKPDLVGMSLHSLILYSSPAENRAVTTRLLEILISMGNSEEIVPSLKLTETTDTLKEMRINSTNLAYSKILDFLIEY
jgi:hypothetical protein